MQGSIEELADFFMAIWDELEFEGYKVKGIQQEKGTNKVVLSLSKGKRHIQVTMAEHNGYYMIYVESENKMMIKDYNFESGDNLFDILYYRIEAIDKEIEKEEKQEEFRDLLTEQWRVFNG